MNQVILLGRLTKDNQIEESKDGKTKILRNVIAVDRDKNTTDFVPVTFLGKTAEIVNEFIKKGQRLLITGELHVSNYEDQKTKEKKTFTNVLANRVDFIEKKENNSENTPEY